MGDPKKQRKKYETPRHPWRRGQIEEELKLIGEYGLRNKRELWRYKTALSQVRGIARSLLGKGPEERARSERSLLEKLTRLGVLQEGATLDHVLDLEVRDLLERRLQTIVFRTGLAKSIYQARQLISHGHIAIRDQIVSIPGYSVLKAEEPSMKYASESPLSEPNHPVRQHPSLGTKPPTIEKLGPAPEGEE